MSPTTTIHNTRQTEHTPASRAFLMLEGAVAQTEALGVKISRKAKYADYGLEIPPVGVKFFRKKKKFTENYAETYIRTMTNEEIIHKLMYDLNFLSKFVLPDLCHYNFPKTLQSIWQMVIKGLMSMEDFIAEAKYVLGIPRGFSKTTLMKLVLVYNIIFSSKTFMLVVGSSETNAQAISKDVVDMMQTSQMIHVFGEIGKFSNNSADFRRFKFLGKDVILKSKGVLTSLRGLNVGNRRPNFILCDDMQTEESARSPVESDSVRTWFSSTLLEAHDPEGCMYVYVGNTYAYEGSLITSLIKDPEWTSNTIGAITVDGESIWEELKPLTKLLAGYLQAKRLNKEANWLAQMMNAIDLNMNTNVDIDLVEEMSMKYWGKLTPQDKPILKCVIIDPASDRENADNVAIGLVEEYERNIPVIAQLSSKRRNPMQTIMDTLELCLENECYVVVVEGIAYQQTLQFWFQYFFDEWGVDWIHVVVFNAHRSSKNVRILNSFDYLEKGEIVLSPQALDFYRVEAKAFNHLKTTNKDDGLDVVSEAKLQLQDKYMVFTELQDLGYLAFKAQEKDKGNNNGYQISPI